MFTKTLKVNMSDLQCRVFQKDVSEIRFDKKGNFLLLTKYKIGEGEQNQLENKIRKIFNLDKSHKVDFNVAMSFAQKLSYVFKTYSFNAVLLSLQNSFGSAVINLAANKKIDFKASAVFGLCCGVFSPYDHKFIKERFAELQKICGFKSKGLEIAALVAYDTLIATLINEGKNLCTGTEVFSASDAMQMALLGSVSSHFAMSLHELMHSSKTKNL